MPRKPVTLSLAIDYAVCEKICVPADGKAELTLTGKPGEQDGRLAQQRGAGAACPPSSADGALAIRAVKREGTRIVVDVAAPAGARRSVRRRADAGLGAAGALRRSRARRPASSASPSSSTGCRPTPSRTARRCMLTAVAGEQAIEVPYRLD